MVEQALPAVRGDLYRENCRSREVLKHVASRWSLLVLRALLSGLLRFSELHRKVDGISGRMLSRTLQSLEKIGFVNRSVVVASPVHTEYRLTAIGLEASQKLMCCQTGWKKACHASSMTKLGDSPTDRLEICRSYIYPVWFQACATITRRCPT